MHTTCILRNKQHAFTHAKKRGRFAQFAFLALPNFIGQWLTFAVCWGWRNEGRTDGAGLEILVRYAFALVEARQMNRIPTTLQASGIHGEQLSFLPPPPFCPSWPTKNTLADKALKMLMDGRMIDHPDFEGSTQSWRLGAVIFTLRALGWPIETIDVPSPTEHDPDRVIALYRLDGKYTAQALAMNGRAANVS